MKRYFWLWYLLLVTVAGSAGSGDGQRVHQCPTCGTSEADPDAGQ